MLTDLDLYEVAGRLRDSGYIVERSQLEAARLGIGIPRSAFTLAVLKLAPAQQSAEWNEEAGRWPGGNLIEVYYGARHIALQGEDRGPSVASEVAGLFGVRHIRQPLDVSYIEVRSLWG